jgi:hypothetical protein
VAGGDARKSGFVAAVLWELSGGLCKGQLPDEDLCDWRCLVCCPLLPLLVGFCSFEFVLYIHVEYLHLVDVVFLLMSL